MNTQFNPAHFAYKTPNCAYVSFPDKARRIAASRKLQQAENLAWHCRENGDGRFWLGLQLRKHFTTK